MKKTSLKRRYRSFLLVVMTLLGGGVSGCTSQIVTPMQSDGWSAQPLINMNRFSSDANLDSATGIPVGDEGYYLYILSDAANWDFSSSSSLVFSIWRHPWAHSWIILESPKDRLEFGHTGDFGLATARYHEGVIQRGRAGDPNPIAYLWETMADGEFQNGRPNRPPSFVWRMPISQRHHQLIQEYVADRKYDTFGLRNNNCTDMVAKTASLAGIFLTHRIRLTLPPETKFLGQTLRVWTDPQYRILEFSTPEILEMELRQLARMGIGSDVTEWYLALKR